MPSGPYNNPAILTAPGQQITVSEASGTTEQLAAPGLSRNIRVLAVNLVPRTAGQVWELQQNATTLLSGDGPVDPVQIDLPNNEGLDLVSPAAGVDGSIGVSVLNSAIIVGAGEPDPAGVAGTDFIRVAPENIPPGVVGGQASP